MEGEIVDVNVGLNQVQSWDSDFPGIISTWVANYFKIGLSFVGLTWLVVGNSEDIASSKKYVEPHDHLDEFPQLIVTSYIHYWCTSPEHIAKML